MMKRGNLLIKLIELPMDFAPKASLGQYIMYNNDCDLLIYKYII